MRKFFRRHAPRHETLQSNWMLRPFAPMLMREGVLRFNRRSVALAVGIGLFFAFIVPVAQIALAAIVAIVLRANIPVAALSTFVTNPFTFPPIYYLAYKTGTLFTGVRPPAVVVHEEIAEALESHGEAVTHWLPTLWEWLTGVGQPLVIGLVIFAVVGAVLGYVAVDIAWRWTTVRRLRRRIAARR